MEFDIEKYKWNVVEKFMNLGSNKIKEEFQTQHICWAFVMWTYRELGYEVESEKKLKLLVDKFERVDKPYRFPDIILFKGHKGGLITVARHAGIMLGETKFVHMGEQCNGLQFSSLDRNPYNIDNKMVIRLKQL